MENSTNKTIIYNTTLLKWYLEEDLVKHIHDEQYKEKLFTLFTEASYEDPFIFMRIVLYIANTRTKDDQEIAYKTLIHFMCILLPQFILNNIDMLVKFGNKNDILYLLSAPNLQKKVVKYIEYKSKYDKDYKSLLDGKLIKTEIDRFIKYDDCTITELLEKILDDSAFNGIKV